jgi:hypothetical protein
MNTSFEPKSQAPTQRVAHRENHSAKAYPSRTIVHAKLEMTEPGDHDEQEADAVANTMVSEGRIARKISGGGSSSSGIAVSRQMESQLNHLQGGGQAMPEGLRNMMESGFGQDFSQVRLHTDSEAASMSSSIHAKAFTLGNDIYFNRGQFSPETTEGQRLVAHELTHVALGGGRISRDPEPDPNPDTNQSQDVASNGQEPDLTQDTEPQPKDLKSIVTSQDTEDQKVDDLIELLVTKAVAAEGYIERDVLIKDIDKFYVNRYLTKEEREEGEEVYSIKKKRIFDKLQIKSKSIYLSALTIKLQNLKSETEEYAFLKTLRRAILKNKAFIRFLNGDTNKFETEYFTGVINKGLPSEANITKFQYDIGLESEFGLAWCDWFVHWCFVNAFHPMGLEMDEKNTKVQETIKNSIYEYTMYENLDIYVRKGDLLTNTTKRTFPKHPTRGNVPDTKRLYNEAMDAKKYNDPSNPVPSDFITSIGKEGTPKKGDVIYFIKQAAEGPHHIGLVINVKSDMVYTIEGNTDNKGSVTKEDAFGNSVHGESSNVEGAGNGVFIKQYKITDESIDGYGRPDYKGLLHFLIEYYNGSSYTK